MAVKYTPLPNSQYGFCLLISFLSLSLPPLSLNTPMGKRESPYIRANIILFRWTSNIVTKSKTQVTSHSMTGVQKLWGRWEKNVKWVVRVFVKDVDQDPFHCHLEAHCHEMAGEILLHRESKPPFKWQCKPSTSLRTHIWIQMFLPSQKNIYIMDSITFSKLRFDFKNAR